MVRSHVPTWEVTESAGYETSWIELGDIFNGLGLGAGPNCAAVPTDLTYLARTERGARVRYAAGKYRSDVEFDPDGLVVEYPGMAGSALGRPLVPSITASAHDIGRQ